jgi:hypothetical protein
MKPIYHYAILLASLLALVSCVTINIYFPAAAAEKAADKIIDEVWQIKQGQTPATSPSAPSDSKK